MQAAHLGGRLVYVHGAARAYTERAAPGPELRGDAHEHEDDQAHDHSD